MTLRKDSSYNSAYLNNRPKVVMMAPTVGCRGGSSRKWWHVPVVKQVPRSRSGDTHHFRICMHF